MALQQLWLARSDGLSAWCGGGFGMFSTADGWGTRHLHAVALSPAFQTSLEIPRELEDDVRRALALPTKERLRTLALELARSAPTELEPPESIRIDVFARQNDPETLAPGAVLLRSVEVPLADMEPAPR